MVEAATSAKEKETSNARVNAFLYPPFSLARLFIIRISGRSRGALDFLSTRISPGILETFETARDTVALLPARLGPLVFLVVHFYFMHPQINVHRSSSLETLVYELAPAKVQLPRSLPHPR